MLPGVEGPLPCHVHKVMRTGAAQPDNAGFGERGRKPMAKQGHLIGKRHLVERQANVAIQTLKAGAVLPLDHLRAPAA